MQSVKHFILISMLIHMLIIPNFLFTKLKFYRVSDTIAISTSMILLCYQLHTKNTSTDYSKLLITTIELVLCVSANITVDMMVTHRIILINIKAIALLMISI